MPAIAQGAGSRQIATWKRLLYSDDVQKRSSAATSLLASGDAAGLEALRSALASDQPVPVRVSVLKAFEFWGNDSAVDLVIAALEDPDE